MLRGHDAGHGCVGDDAGALSPPIRKRHAGSEHALALSRRDSAASAGRPDPRPARLDRWCLWFASSPRRRRMGIAPPLQLRRRGPASAHCFPELRRLATGRHAGPVRLDNIAQFFSSRKASGSRPKLEIPVPAGAPDSAAASVSVIRNTAKAWSSAARETVTMRRLRYNLQNSA